MYRERVFRIVQDPRIGASQKWPSASRRATRHSPRNCGACSCWSGGRGNCCGRCWTKPRGSPPATVPDRPGRPRPRAALGSSRPSAAAGPSRRGAVERPHRLRPSSDGVVGAGPRQAAAAQPCPAALVAQPFQAVLVVAGPNREERASSRAAGCLAHTGAAVGASAWAASAREPEAARGPRHACLTSSQSGEGSTRTSSTTDPHESLASVISLQR